VNDRLYIILIDDDEINNFINRKLLTRYDPELDISEFIVAREALAHLKNGTRHLPDIILLDINMPEMNGWEFIMEFSKLNLSSKVVMLTSSIDERDEEKALTFPEIKGYFTKPLDNDKIQEILTPPTGSLELRKSILLPWPSPSPGNWKIQSTEYLIDSVPV